MAVVFVLRNGPASVARARIPDDERAAILAACQAGESRNAIARRFNRSPGSISTIAHDAGHEFDQTAAKKAHAALRDYDLAARLNLINRGLAKAGEMLDMLASPADLRSWSTALGILIDKRRLEEPATEGGAIDELMETLRRDARTADREATDEHP